MNYRHAFHAGNFADVVKHAVLVRILVHLREKPRPSASSTPMPAPAATISPARRRPAAANGATASAGSSPPRSPSRRARCSRPISTPSRAQSGRRARHLSRLAALVRALLRPQDRLIACELEPSAARALARNLARRPPRQGDRDRRLDRAHRLCAAEGAARPGADRSAVRGAGRICRGLAEALAAAHRKWRPASICCGTRSRSARRRTRWRAALRRSGHRQNPACRTQSSPPPRADTGLRGSGLIVVNPPWTLAGELAILLPALAADPVRRGRRHRIASIGSRAKSEFRHFSTALRLASLHERLALTFRLLGGPAE